MYGIGSNIAQPAPGPGTLGLAWTTQSYAVFLGASGRASEWLTASLALFPRLSLPPPCEDGGPGPRAGLLPPTLPGSI